MIFVLLPPYVPRLFTEPAMRFTARATFSDRPPLTDADMRDPLFGDTPKIAARNFYWRLGEDQRAACLHIVVGPFLEHRAYDLYAGPELVFAPRHEDGFMTQIVEPAPVVGKLRWD